MAKSFSAIRRRTCEDFGLCDGLQDSVGVAAHERLYIHLQVGALLVLVMQGAVKLIVRKLTPWHARSGTGMLAEKVAAPVGVCHWALLPEFAQILICEDLQKDER